MDSKERFSSRVETYVKYRPAYPEEALDFLYRTVGLRPGAEVADVGAGTGIFSRLLLERGSRVWAVEPNKDMREAAVAALGGAPEFHAIPGSAEATGLGDRSVDHVVCAQSFHWFDRTAALAEFRRILRPGGRVALIWNSRQTAGTSFREGYERLLQTYCTGYEQVGHKSITQETLRSFFRNGGPGLSDYPFCQLLDFESLKGRLLSSSYCPLPGQPNYEPLMEELRELFDANQEDGRISFDYRTEIYWGEV
ncbi:class I SAM-dependent methyltransferase [Gorillibacterium sp. sgz5001074]|uniref:class I SAM-dependent methyltransferase n=1 Tax=Gorillibacterium sp. sgz5001074 TaxID=3446695 RepID=UPI003F6679FD